MGDVLLNDNGDLPKRPTIENDHRITRQRIEAALGLHEGEWLLDETAGLPWLEWFQTTPTPLDQMQATIRREIADVTGVGEVAELSHDIDRSNGVITFEGTVYFDEDDEESGLNFEFVVHEDPHEFHPIFTIQQLVR